MISKDSQNIAIIGAGYSGLATAWHLLKRSPHAKITLFDPAGYGGEASKISAGLLHKYAGMHAKRNRLSVEGEAATRELLAVASAALNKSVILSHKILRLALTPEQEADFAKSAAAYDDVEWLPKSACRQIDPELPDAPAILIHSGVAVDTDSYLKGLFTACQERGVLLKQERIGALEELEGFDIVIAAVGASMPLWPELQTVPIRPQKGQLLLLDWKGRTPLPLSIVSQIYLTMRADKQALIVGATYERNFMDANPDPEKAINDLLPRALLLYPALASAQVLDVKAGLRASTPDHLPIVGHLTGNLYIITGMGSRGLLYHSLYAKKLAAEIFPT